MTRARTEDDLLEFKRLVRWLTGVTLTQVDAETELRAIEARYAEPLTVRVDVTASDPISLDPSTYVVPGLVLETWSNTPPEPPKIEVGDTIRATLKSADVEVGDLFVVKAVDGKLIAFDDRAGDRRWWLNGFELASKAVIQ